MSTPNPQMFDQGNLLLAQVTARLDATVVTEPSEAPKGVLTIRTASTTLTVILGAEDVRMWGDIITGLAGQMGGPGNMPQRPVAATITDVIRLGKDGKGA